MENFQLFANREQTSDYNRRVGAVLNRIVCKYEFLPVKKDLNYLVHERSLVSSKISDRENLNQEEPIFR